MSADDDPARRLSEVHRRRAVIVAVRPVVDGGRYPVKRVVGEPLAVEADIVADGHDVVRAVVLDRAPGAAVWRETELGHGANDTWRATVELSALGRHRYTVVAWVDAFATWRR
ncbi:MAG TPA: maltotransferase domain-containing protein, partial [Kofleriaceae bacterium]